MNPMYSPSESKSDRTKRIIGLCALVLAIIVFIFFRQYLIDREEQANRELEELKMANYNRKVEQLRLEGEQREANLYPTQQELDEINSNCPIKINDNTIFTGVTFDKKSKTVTHYYEFVPEWENIKYVTPEMIEEYKKQMCDEIRKDPQLRESLAYGRIFVYRYDSKKENKGYAIMITREDLYK